MKTLIARGEVLDIVTFLAAVNRIADLLAVEGDADSVAVRRSKAVGILGQPDRALALLAAHQHDPDQPAPPVEPRHGGWRRAQSDQQEPDEPEPEPQPEPEGSENSAGPVCGMKDEAPQREPSDEDLPDDEPAAGLGREDDEPGMRSLGLSNSPAASAGAIGFGCGRSGVRVQLYVHLTDAALRGTDPGEMCRVEGVGPVTAQSVRNWLQRPDLAVTVRPVVVPGQAVPVDGYEIPPSVREAVWLRHPASAFPWSWCTDRHSLQLDHIRPYLPPDRGGPPGQPAPENLAPLVGTEHQRKTSRRWQERSPAPGVYLWRSPHGWIQLVTNQGTFPLGDGSTAQAIWHAAAPAHDQIQVA